MIGYIFLNEEDAQEARKKVDDFYNYPLIENTVTKHFINYLQFENYWIIVYQESLLDVLGEPVLITNTLFNNENN